MQEEDLENRPGRSIIRQGRNSRYQAKVIKQRNVKSLNPKQKSPTSFIPRFQITGELKKKWNGTNREGSNQKGKTPGSGRSIRSYNYLTTPDSEEEGTFDSSWLYTEGILISVSTVPRREAERAEGITDSIRHNKEILELIEKRTDRTHFLVCLQCLKTTVRTFVSCQVGQLYFYRLTHFAETERKERKSFEISETTAERE